MLGVGFGGNGAVPEGMGRSSCPRAAERGAASGEKKPIKRE